MGRSIKISNQEEKDAIIKYLQSNEYPKDTSKIQKREIRRKAAYFIMIGDTMCYKTPNGSPIRVVLNFEKKLIKLILNEEHECSHKGIKKMIKSINQKYYGIPVEEIKEFVKNCKDCIGFNNLNTVKITLINEITKKYDRYMMDCVDLRKYADQNDGYSWILNIMDTYTKYLWSFKMKNKSAENVKECLDTLFKNFGVPVELQSDNGKEFANSLLETYLKKLNIKIIHGRPRNPKSQGQIERANQTIKRWLAKTMNSLNEKKWIDILPEVVYQYNTSYHEATGESPFLLFHGQSGFNSMIQDPAIVEFSEEGALEKNNLPFDLSSSDTNIDIVENNCFSSLADRVRDHFEIYKNRTIKNANPNITNKKLSVDDIVVLKIDFDNNVRTKRAPFDAFFTKEEYKVIQNLSNNRIKVKNTETGEIKIVSITQVKKIKS